MVIKINKDKFTYRFSKGISPVAYAKAGDVAVFEVMDNLSGQIRSEDIHLEAIDISKRNPSTGPLYIEGVKAGDTLVVDVLDIKVGSKGWIRVFPGRGALHDKKFEPKIKIVDIVDGYIISNDLKISVKPMVGTTRVHLQMLKFLQSCVDLMKVIWTSKQYVGVLGYISQYLLMVDY